MLLKNQIITQKATELGFSKIGFAAPMVLNDNIQFFKEWLDDNNNASMEYLKKNLDIKENVNILYPEARSVIVLALNYFTDIKQSEKPNCGVISRYAIVQDYHQVLKLKTNKLIKELKIIDIGFDARVFIDSNFVLEKTYAEKAGIGWQGKNSLIITEEFGSWIFLAVMVTNREFEASKPVENLCSDCRKCIEACPTKAINENKTIDARKCISFHTIENKNAIPLELKGKFNNYIFGCDICQEVCPFNIKHSLPTKDKDFFPFKENEIPIEEILKMTEEDFSKRFADSPIKRTKLEGLKRNAKFLLK
ncbi:MAG: tRNA epoxyqueuosine(34) reductase QueG [Ignavibacteriales bacterium]|nr:tRNA epoxyqueuosine(34) reductase QueG [Ignavibacteriales bacterium]